MSIEIREFDTMVSDILTRIVNANVGITNTSVGSVIRTIVEAIVAEQDIQYYQIDQIYNALGIDNAVGEDLDNLVSILGVVRKPATKCTGVATYGRSTPSESDISIQYAELISTKPDSEGNTVEFITTDIDAILPTGDIAVNIDIEASEAGLIYLPIGSLNVMVNPIIGIEYVTNLSIISGGTDQETDDELRERSKSALSSLGKGTSTALETAIISLSGVVDAMTIDMSRGVGTADVVVVTSVIPPPSELNTLILSTVAATKSAGIDVDVVYPTIITTAVTVTTTAGTANQIGNAILSYFNTLGIADYFIINQMERVVLNTVNNPSMDITTTLPASNIYASGTQIIRSGVITINGSVWSA